MLRLAVVLLLLLTGCGRVPLSFGGGPNVAANTQAGANNVQGVQNDDRQIASRVTGEVRQERAERQVRADKIETVNTTNTPPWIIWALVVAVLLDSPLRWPEQIARAFRRKAA